MITGDRAIEAIVELLAGGGRSENRLAGASDGASTIGAATFVLTVVAVGEEVAIALPLLEVAPGV
jgi:hypothetical protein